MGKRNSGIELLRLVLMFMVCILHILGQGGVLDASEWGSTAWRVYWLLEICAYCAVDGFAIISGYTASNRPQKTEKIVDMWFQAFFYSFILTVILSLCMTHTGELHKTLLMPVTFRSFWYFTAYFALFFAKPILNSFLFSIDENTAKKAFLILFVLFSLMGILADPFQSQGGYSAIWLMVLYCLGALAKKIRLFEERKTITLVAALFMMCALTWGILVVWGNVRLISYISPTIVMNGLLLVVLFKRIRIKGTFVRRISSLAFGIYLFQLNTIIWNDVLKSNFAFVTEQPLYIGVCWVFAAALILFAVGLAVEFFRSQVAKWIKLSWLSEKIVLICEKALTKMFVFLK